jgi:FecR protein
MRQAPADRETVKLAIDWNAFCFKPLQIKPSPVRLAALAAVILTAFQNAELSHANPSAVTVRVDRWLVVQQLSGSVTYFNAAGTSRAATLGDRLQAIGDGITTGKDASATLGIDTAVGTVEVAPETYLLVQSLEVTPSDGHITHLRIDRGSVHLQIRAFTNPDSRLEIETPAGISGVRGTEFGVNLQPNGTMGVATLRGNVVTTAYDQAVAVPAGFQNITVPGESPSAAIPFTNEPRLEYQIERVAYRGIRHIVLLGQVDPTSIVTYRGKPHPIDRDGQFYLVFPALSRLKVQITVTTPLGQTQTYDLDLI